MSTGQPSSTVSLWLIRTAVAYFALRSTNPPAVPRVVAGVRESLMS